MKVNETEWLDAGQPKHSKIVCPKCGNPWLVDFDGEYEIPEPQLCSHLKFIAMRENEELLCFNHYLQRDFLSLLFPNTTQVDKKEELKIISGILDPRYWESSTIDIFDKETWQTKKSPKLDVVFFHTEYHRLPVIACIFGAKLD